jgi:hypothetical protein
MGFLGVYKAIYDYVPQGESELAITEGDILYVLEKSGEDDWWKAKKKATGDDDDEPVGLIPNNYIEEVRIDYWLYSLKPQYSYAGIPWRTCYFPRLDLLHTHTLG